MQKLPVQSSFVLLYEGCEELIMTWVSKSHLEKKIEVNKDANKGPSHSLVCIFHGFFFTAVSNGGGKLLTVVEFLWRQGI
jgi:hypothetical protein